MVFYILGDVIHFLTIFVVFDMFFGFKRKKIEHKWIMSILGSFVVVGMSVFIYMYNNHFVETLIYMLTIILLLCFFYKEAIYNSCHDNLGNICYVYDKYDDSCFL